MKLPLKHEIRKPSKTLAGVTPIAVMTKPKKCKHGTCLYCPSLNVPQSYTPKSPPVLRASSLKYNPKKQVQSRLTSFKLMNHPTDKIEIIIMGGNFLGFHSKYQTNFIKQIYNALNNKTSKTLEQAKKLNEKTKHRCVALCIETRPDSINQKTINQLLNFGCTRVELGVQCLDDKIYKKVNRGHTLKDVIRATQELKNAGFKIGYHMMLGLPLSNPKKDLEMFKELFKNQDFKPDQLKIYPCQVIKGAALEKHYKKQQYQPYTKEQIQELIIKIMKIIPNYCRVMRIMREIPPDFLTAGTTRIDLRRDIDSYLKSSKANIKEIRFREIGFKIRDLKLNQKINHQLKLKTTKYKASGGTEYFLEIINKQNILFGLLRLRISNNQAIIRELHVYGKALPIGNKPENIGQHSGLGKQLIKEAEKIVRESKQERDMGGRVSLREASKNKTTSRLRSWVGTYPLNQLKIISGVGVKEYYKKLGYSPNSQNTYMFKKF